MYLSFTARMPEGPLPVTVIDGARLFASVDLTEDCDIRLTGPEECDRLIIAATTAKRMLEMAGQPHDYEPGAGTAGTDCARCGRPRAVHEPAAASAS